MPVTDAERLWDVCAEELRSEVSEATWKAWFEGIVPLSLEDDVLCMAVPSALVRQRLEGRYLQPVQDALADALGRPLGVRLEVRTEERGADRAHDAGGGPPPDATRIPDATGSPTAGGGGDSTVAEPAPAFAGRYTFDAFVSGESNRLAHAACQMAAEHPGGGSYNPLFIHGRAGLGKTHLLHAIRNYVEEHFPNRQVRYVAAETFLNDFVEALRTHGSASFKRKYRDPDVLLVDDIQFFIGKERSGDEFFHTYNHLYGEGRQIVLTSEKPPAEATMEERLRSRLLSGLVVELRPPELETRLAIIANKASRERCPVPHDVLEFIARNVTTNIRELEGALNRVMARASLDRQALNLELAQDVLSDVLLENRPVTITPERILALTAETFGFSTDDVKGPSRRRPLVIARQVGMYVTRELTDYSYPAIARVYGGRDHTTVIHAVDKIANLMKDRRPVYVQVESIIKRLKAPQ